MRKERKIFLPYESCVTSESRRKILDAYFDPIVEQANARRARQPSQCPSCGRIIYYHFCPDCILRESDYP